MIGRSPALQVFSMLSGVAYTACFYYNWPLFRYYPAVEQFTLGPLGPDAGPAILWYGWLATAFLGSALVALVVPRRAAEKLSPRFVWIAAAVVLIGITIYEKSWFI